MKENDLSFFKLLHIFIFLLFPFFINAASGDLDVTFGNGGKVITPIAGHYTGGVYALGVHSNGKIIAAGDGPNFFLIRYNSDGTLDGSFGVNGVVGSPFYFSGDAYSYSAVIQPDDKIVVVGTHLPYPTIDLRFAVARFNYDGTFDNSFGSGGRYSLNLGTNESDFEILFSVAIQNDAKIVAAGRFKQSVKVIRLNPNGVLDTSFAKNGIYTSSQTNLLVRGYANKGLLIQPDGKILVGGESIINNLNKLTVIRLDRNGVLDTGFADNGILQPDLTLENFNLTSIALQSNSKIVIGGTTSGLLRMPYPYLLDFPFSQSFNYRNEIALVRYNQDGSIDRSFGNNGVFVSRSRNFGASIRSMVIQPDDKILACGIIGRKSRKTNTHLTTSQQDFVVVRFEKNGLPDVTFGSAGMISTDFDMQRSELASDMVIYPDGKFVVGGLNNWGNTSGAKSDFVIARYLN